MLKFDIKREFRFGLFFDQQQQSAVDDRVIRLPSVIESAVPGGPTLRIKFGTPVVSEQLSLGPVVAQRVPLWTWRSNVWEMTWSPIRLDIVVDALAYEQVAERELVLDTVRRRLCPNLTKAALELGLPVTRAVMTSVMQGNETRKNEAVSLVAAAMFSEETSARARRGEVLELAGSLNQPVKVALPVEGAGNVEVDVNQIEQLAAEWSLTADVPKVVLRHATDVNTTPALASALSSSGLETFFALATEWTADRWRPWASTDSEQVEV